MLTDLEKKLKIVFICSTLHCKIMKNLQCYERNLKYVNLIINDLFFCPLAKNSPCLTLWWHWLSFKNLKILCNNLENFKTVCSHIYTKHFKDLNASHLSIATWELLSYSIIMTFDTLKVSKFQNEFVKPSFLPKYEQKIVKISTHYTGQKFWQFFVRIFGETMASQIHKFILKFTDLYA